jgi:hypothetical protein
MLEKFLRLFLLTAGLTALMVCTTMSICAQQRDPNQPRPTPTPPPTPVIKAGNRRVVTTTSDVGRVDSPTLMPGIYGQIRWKKELGLPYDASQGRPPYHICNMFALLLSMQNPGSPGTFGVTRTAHYRASAEVVAGKLAEDGDYYVCNYEITKLNGASLPHNRAMVISPELDAQLLRGKENAPWSVGSAASPPPGQQRAIIIIGGRPNNGLILTNNQPHKTLDFEMVYRPIPAPPR